MAKHKTKHRKAKLEATTANDTKAYVGGSYGYFGYNHPTSGRSYRADEYSASQAYTFNVAVASATEFWQSWLNGLKFEIRDGLTDKVLISSDNRRVPEGVGAKFVNAVKYHKRKFKHSYFSSLAFSDALYGESYTRFVCNDWGFPQLLEWLNPLGVEPTIIQGRIVDYRYSNAEGYETLNPKQVAFRINTRDSQNDLRGLSRVMAIIDTLNIEAAEKESLKAWFKNNMQLGGLISPSNPDINMSIGQVQKLEDDFRRDNKGVVNAGRWAIAPANMTVTPFPAPDIEKNFTLIKPLRDEILMAMKVYPQLAGDPSDANYDSAYDIKRQWWELLGIPYAHDIEDYINDQILPVLEPYSDCYFAFVLTPYEVEKPEVVSQDFSAGYIDMVKAAELRGYEGNPKLSGIHIINGMPMHEDVIVKLAHAIPSQYALDYANAAAAGQAMNSNADTALGITSPIMPALPSGEIASPTIETPATTEEAPLVSYNLDPTTGKMKAVTVDEFGNAIEKTHHDHTHELPTIVDSPNADVLEELSAWKKFVTNGKAQKRPFDAKALRGDIGDALQLAIDSKDRQAILDAFHLAQEKLSVKAIQATRLDFENDFDTLLGRARSEKMGRVQWASAMRAIIRRYGLKAYIDGLADGGVEDEPSEDDRITINELSANNSGYVTELGNALYKSDTELSDGQADIKAAMWYNKSIDPYYQAGLLSADANSIYEWVYGKTEVHCDSCKALNGQRHRLRRWKANIMPKSSDLECGGFLCDCNLVKVRGRERGNYLS